MDKIAAGPVNSSRRGPARWPICGGRSVSAKLRALRAGVVGMDDYGNWPVTNGGGRALPRAPFCWRHKRHMSTRPRDELRDDPARITRVLGVDTALRTTGYGIVDHDGRTFHAVDCGIIKTKPKEPLSECLRRLAGGVRELTRKYAPDVAIIEGIFYCRNVRTAMVLGSARGAVIAALAELSIPMYEYSPRKVKQAVCGYGNASKEQVALLVAEQLHIGVNDVHEDATDALALAICHIQMATSAQGLMLPKQL